MVVFKHIDKDTAKEWLIELESCEELFELYSDMDMTLEHSLHSLCILDELCGYDRQISDIYGTDEFIIVYSNELE